MKLEQGVPCQTEAVRLNIEQMRITWYLSIIAKNLSNPDCIRPAYFVLLQLSTLNVADGLIHPSANQMGSLSIGWSREHWLEFLEPKTKTPTLSVL